MNRINWVELEPKISARAYQRSRKLKKLYTDPILLSKKSLVFLSVCLKNMDEKSFKNIKMK